MTEVNQKKMFGNSFNTFLRFQIYVEINKIWDQRLCL